MKVGRLHLRVPCGTLFLVYPVRMLRVRMTGDKSNRLIQVRLENWLLIWCLCLSANAKVNDD